MIRLLAKLLRVLNSEAAPGQISLAICLGMVAGLTPLLSLHNLIVLLLALVIRVNLSAFILGTVFFSGVAYAIDPVFHAIGLNVLNSEVLEGVFTSMYNNPVMRVARFNNTIVMGSLVSSVIAFVPVAFVLNTLIRKYREHVLTWIRKTRVMKMLTGSRFYNIYQSVTGWRDSG